MSHWEWLYTEFLCATVRKCRLNSTKANDSWGMVLFKHPSPSSDNFLCCWEPGTHCSTWRIWKYLVSSKTERIIEILVSGNLLKLSHVDILDYLHNWLLGQSLKSILETTSTEILTYRTIMLFHGPGIQRKRKNLDKMGHS